MNIWDRQTDLVPCPSGLKGPGTWLFSVSETVNPWPWQELLDKCFLGKKWIGFVIFCSLFLLSLGAVCFWRDAAHHSEGFVAYLMAHICQMSFIRPGHSSYFPEPAKHLSTNRHNFLILFHAFSPVYAAVLARGSSYRERNKLVLLLIYSQGQWFSVVVMDADICTLHSEVTVLAAH